MSIKTNILEDGLVSFTIKVDGSTVSNETEVLSVGVEFNVNQIATAKIVILDGNASTATFEVSSSDTFVPGGKITIEAGYDNRNNLLFSGIICGQCIRVDAKEGSVLVVECRDESIKTSIGRKNKTYSHKKDSDIFESILGAYSGITTDITSTDEAYPQMVQYNTTDWDFIMSRAQANGLIVTAQNGKISIIKPDKNTKSVLELKYGDSIFELNADLNAVNQLATVKANAWDYSNQAIIDGEKNNTLAGPGNLSSKKLAEVIGLTSFDLQSPAALQEAELKIWSEAQLVKSDYSKIQGDVTCQGKNNVLPGQYMTLSGLGDRFNGNHFVSAVTHDISDGNWITKIRFGISPQWFAEQSHVAASHASGLLPGVNGLFTGTVKQMYDDPDNQYRVLVDIPLFDPSGEGLWARHSSFYASSNAGAFFMPEVGDEVIVGFLNEDPRYPIILGSLYSKPKLKPHEGLNPKDNNTTKAIVSKSGIEINFDDENKIFTIITPSKNKAVFDDQNKKISIIDQNDNSIIMSESGIALKSAMNISIESDKNVTIKGEQGVTITSSAGDITTNGRNIKHNADMEFSADGSASTRIVTGGSLTLNGSIVNIN